MSPFNDHKRIMHREFRRALSHLREKGFVDSQIDQVASLFRGDMDEHGYHQGISEKELSSAIHWLKEHPFSHHLSPHNIETIEKVFSHYL